MRAAEWQGSTGQDVTENHFQELAHVTIEADRLQLCRVGLQLETWGRDNTTLHVCRQSAGRISSFSEEISVFLRNF